MIYIIGNANRFEAIMLKPKSIVGEQYLQIPVMETCYLSMLIWYGKLRKTLQELRLTLIKLSKQLLMTGEPPFFNF